MKTEVLTRAKEIEAELKELENINRFFEFYKLNNKQIVKTKNKYFTGIGSCLRDYDIVVDLPQFVIEAIKNAIQEKKVQLSDELEKL
jgi:predicted transcriptional regulator